MRLFKRCTLIFTDCINLILGCTTIVRRYLHQVTDGVWLKWEIILPRAEWRR